ncbi:MAG: LysR family transcriptional regulator [Bdellovibrionaceae bacterium]|nr:LysR family transcriptional regulator [Pseudobdellovibrionaceae bacterium]
MSKSKLNFSLTQLEYVLTVNRLGQFAKAAEACNVTQPTLSMQIQKLEEELGVVIFDRSKKPILLTDVGRKLVEQMTAVVHEARRIESLIQNEKKGAQAGELRLGVIPTIAPYLLPKLLPHLESNYPEIELVIKELRTSDIIDALENDEIDVGILATPLGRPKIQEVALYYEPFSVFCRKNHEYAAQKKMKYTSLKMDDVWLLEEGHCMRNQVLDLCSNRKVRGGRRRYQFESGNLETLKNLVEQYGGYTLLPSLATENLRADTKLVGFERPVPAREIGLVYRREHFRSELIEVLGDAILASIPDEVRRIRPKDLEVLPITES